jgi:hypothetical protein
MTKPTKSEGANALKGAVAVMNRLCDRCCEVSGECTPAKCKKEAHAIVDAIVDAWNENYGKGSDTTRDNVGGYLCWDWTRFFLAAVRETKPTCWTVDYEVHWDGPRDRARWQACHCWVALHSCQKSDECKVMIDDSWFDGEFVHEAPYLESGSKT